MKKINLFAINAIKKYQKNKQIIGTGHCRFYPSCSNYALEAYTKFSFIRASFLTFFRIIRCNPFAKRRYYPVPLTKDEKNFVKRIKQLKTITISSLVDVLIDNAGIITNESTLKDIIYSYFHTKPCSSSMLDKDIIIGFHTALKQPNTTITSTEEPHDITTINYILSTLYDLNILQNLYTLTDISASPCFPIIKSSDLPLSYFINQFNFNVKYPKMIGIQTTINLDLLSFENINIPYQVFFYDNDTKKLKKHITNLIQQKNDYLYIFISPSALNSSLISYYDYTISINQETSFKPNIQLKY